MNSERKVTIVTAVLNAVGPLAKTIESVMPHLSCRVDYIIVDGGSSDGTLDLIKRHEPSLKCWLSEPDKGVYDAMNKGWSLADENSVVLFLGAGDLLIRLPEDLLVDGCYDEVVYGDVALMDGKAFRPRVGWWLKLYNSLHHQALLIPKGLHPQPPFNLDYPCYADFDFNQRLMKGNVTFRHSLTFNTYAAPPGLTRELNLRELRQVIVKNFGWFWMYVSTCGFICARYFPLLRKLHPVR